MSGAMLTQPPARISAGRTMVPSTVVNLSLTKSFIWGGKKSVGGEMGRGKMRHNPDVESGALMLTCGCSHILIAESSYLPVNHPKQLFKQWSHTCGMTCREFDSFLRGNADELREETCKILFIDSIKIPDRGRYTVCHEMKAHFYPRCLYTSSESFSCK